MRFGKQTLELLAIAFLAMVALPDARTGLPASAQGTEPGFQQWSAPPVMAIDLDRDYAATIATNLGDIDIELFAAEAPLTVNNFVFLATQAFYDGVPFHRVIRGFMVQTGDPTGTGTGGPGYRFADEPVKRAYGRGIVAMANAGPNTNGSQFFIVQGDAVSLPANYTIFGEVVRGIDVVDEIASVPVSTAAGSREPSVPQADVHIEHVTISLR